MQGQKKAKILVVDDEPDNVELLTAFLSDDYDIIPAYSGHEALDELCGLKNDLPNLVLMDIMLKDGTDGVEVAQAIRKEYDLPVVYITAYADDYIMRRAKLTEPFGYILKPFEETELRANIEIAIYKHGMEQKLKESQKWLTAVLNSIADAVIATDQEGNIRLMNPFAVALTGWSQEEAIGKPLSAIFRVDSDEPGEVADDPVRKVIKEGMFYGLGNKTVLVTKSDSRIPVDIIGSPIMCETDRLLGTLVLFYDISDRKRIENMIYSGGGPDY
jgi:PAS domain S-box-containing protein